ncbi:MAG: hypothetical protein AUH19_04590 [Verrucomicrobia bacterium 13_2_20CM_55_10]|nr:MAG: hypothetical protein AUH19_04590 [Verrucomicrobia bacterium 13_2_20CM_55_10]
MESLQAATRSEGTQTPPNPYRPCEKGKRTALGVLRVAVFLFAFLLSFLFLLLKEGGWGWVFFLLSLFLLAQALLRPRSKRRREGNRRQRNGWAMVSARKLLELMSRSAHTIDFV